MTSVISIWNRALASVGTRSTVAAENEDSNEAINCALIYESTRDEVMNMAFWNFARKTATLALLKSAPGTPSNPGPAAATWSSAYPAPPWLFEYAYPVDCLQMRMIMPQPLLGYNGPVPIFPEGGSYYPPAVGAQYPAVPFMTALDTNDSGNDINVVLTNQYQALGVYTKRVTDPNLFGAQFVEALVAAMAAKLVSPLVGDKALANQKFVEANGWVLQARASDGNEGLTVIDNMPDWITIREDWGGAWAGYFVAPYGPLYAVY